jgi:hypothetical protein
MPKAYSLPPLLFLGSSPSDIEVSLPQLQDCGSSLSNSSLNNNFLQLNLALAGKVLSVLTVLKSQKKCYLSCAFKFKSVVTTTNYSLGPDHLDLALASSLFYNLFLCLASPRNNVFCGCGLVLVSLISTVLGTQSSPKYLLNK